MKYALWFIAIFILLIIQAGVFVPLRLAPINLLLVLVIVSLLFAGFDFSLGLAAACGILLDILSGSHDGILTLTFVCTFLLMYWLVNFVVSREANTLILFSCVAAGTILYFLLLILFNRFFDLFHLGSSINLPSFFLSDLPKTLLFNLLLTYPVMRYFSLVKAYEPVRN